MLQIGIIKSDINLFNVSKKSLILTVAIVASIRIWNIREMEFILSKNLPASNDTILLEFEGI